MKPPAIANERELIIKHLELFICFDNPKYGCEHSSCYELIRLIADIKAGKHLER